MKKPGVRKKRKKKTGQNPVPPQDKKNGFNPRPESQVPSEPHQENNSAANKGARLQEGQDREQNADVTNGVTFPPGEKIEEAKKATEHIEHLASQQSPTKRTARNYRKRHDCLMLLFSGILAASATIALIISYVQWTTMRDQLDRMEMDSNSTATATERHLKLLEGQLTHMRDAAHLEQRAWVGYHRGTTEKLSAGKRIQCRIDFCNTGKTPALHVSTRLFIIIWPAYPSIIGKFNMGTVEFLLERLYPKYRLFETQGSSLAPNAIMGDTAHCSYEISESLLNDLKSRKCTVYVFGTVRYDDIFKQHHTTQCLYWIDCEKLTWEQCAEHNGMN